MAMASLVNFGRPDLEDLDQDQFVRLADEVRREAIRRDLRSSEAEQWAYMEQDVMTPEEWVWENRFRLQDIFERSERAANLWTERMEYVWRVLQKKTGITEPQKKKGPGKFIPSP